MMLIADGDVSDPVIVALQKIEYPIVRYSELDFPVRPDRELMAKILSIQGIMITMDMGMPSQAYAFQYAQHGLTVVLLRWKQSRPKDYQEMVLAILRDGESWAQIASNEPSIISVNRRGSRPRAWSSIPPSIADSAKGQLKMTFPSDDIT